MDTSIKSLKYKGKKYTFNFSDLCKLGILMLTCGRITKEKRKFKYFFYCHESELTKHIKETFKALNCKHKVINQYEYYGSNNCEIYELCSPVLINWLKRFLKDSERFIDKADDDLKQELLKIILSDDWEEDVKKYSERRYIFLPDQANFITLCANLLKSINYTNLFVITEYDNDTNEIIDYNLIIKAN